MSDRDAVQTQAGSPAPRMSDDELSARLSACADALIAVVAPDVPERHQALISAEDVVQQTFVDVFSDARRFVPESEGAFFRYLRTIARNNLIEVIRALDTAKRGGRRRRATSDGQEPGFDLLHVLAPAATALGPLPTAARREAVEAVRAAVAALPEAWRRAVELYDLELRDISEIAAILGRSPGAVHLLRNRAFARLRTPLAEYVTRISKTGVNPPA